MKENSDIRMLERVLKILYEHDGKALAERMLSRFGSVPEMFRATYAELMEVDGMTERVATLFTVMLPIHRAALLRSAETEALESEAALVTYGAVYGMGTTEPFDMCVMLDGRNRYINAARLTEEDRFREIVTRVCRSYAEKVVLLRHIPQGFAEPLAPSAARTERLNELTEVLKAVDAEFVDYIAYTPYRFYSLRRALAGTDPVTLAVAASPDPFPRDNLIMNKKNL